VIDALKQVSGHSFVSFPTEGKKPDGGERDMKTLGLNLEKARPVLIKFGTVFQTLTLQN